MRSSLAVSRSKRPTLRVRKAWTPGRFFRTSLSCLGLIASVACGSNEHDDAPAALDSLDAGTFDAGSASEPDTDSSKQTPNDRVRALPGFCARDGADAVRDVFCADDAPMISGLDDLKRALSLDTYQTSSASYRDMAEDGGVTLAPTQPDSGVILNLNIAFLGHSTALSGRLVTPINPRIIVMGQTTFLAFHRGVQRVELATRGRDDKRLRFYLVSFTQPCNQAPAHCSPGDLYTPRIESGWQNVQIQDDEDLKNTSADCRQCHQRGTDLPILLMRELSGPWMHFFAHDREDVKDMPYPEPLGKDLVHDYRRAKGEEPYAGVPSAILRGTIGLALEARVDIEQPLKFDANSILNERWPMGPNGFPAQPNRSAIWDRAYAAFKRGEQLAMPYFAGRATDLTKQAALSETYQRYLTGQLSADALPDLADIYPDDPQVRAEIGLQTEPGATAAEALIQACGPCHNDVLDQTVSRAQFNINLARLDPSERARAIDRIQRPAEAAGSMPPPDTRQLDAEARKKLVEYLASDTRSPDDDALLARAAALGMAVVIPPPSLLPTP